jgi:hypothetical protein
LACSYAKLNTEVAAQPLKSAAMPANAEMREALAQMP